MEWVCTNWTGKHGFALVWLMLAMVVSRAAVAEPIVVLGDSVGNGDFQQLDPFSGGRGDAAGEVVRDETGRRMVTLSPTDSRITFPGWNVRRRYYGGGNGAWGLDGKPIEGCAAWPNTYFFLNSGELEFTSETREVELAAGSVVTISLELISERMLETPASCAGRLEFNTGETFYWTAEEAAVSKVGAPFRFNKQFELRLEAKTCVVVLALSSGRGIEGDTTRSANKIVLDNVRVVAVEPSATLGLINF